MGKIIVKKAVVRKPGFLYYIDGEGNVCEVKMARSVKRPVRKPVKKQVSRKSAKKRR